jgi:SAM-dependent methyltransferase
MRRRGIRELFYAVLWKLGFRFRAASAVHREVFTGIYASNEWGSAESPSGTGSTRERGAHFRGALLDVLERFEVRSIVDAPCGDFNWMRDVVSERHAYTGIDIVEELIARNRTRYGAANQTFLCADLTADPLPAADVILCRDCLVHFSYADIHAAIANFRRSGAKYLLTTTFNDANNIDIRTGGWRPLNLQAEPFSFPPPLATIDEFPPGLPHAYPNKKLSLWALGTTT